MEMSRKARWGCLEEGLGFQSWDWYSWEGEMLVISKEGKIATKAGLWRESRRSGVQAALGRVLETKRHSCAMHPLLREPLSCRRKPSGGPAGRPLF